MQRPLCAEQYPNDLSLCCGRHHIPHVWSNTFRLHLCPTRRDSQYWFPHPTSLASQNRLVVLVEAVPSRATRSCIDVVPRDKCKHAAWFRNIFRIVDVNCPHASDYRLVQGWLPTTTTILSKVQASEGIDSIDASVWGPFPQDCAIGGLAAFVIVRMLVYACSTWLAFEYAKFTPHSMNLVLSFSPIPVPQSVEVCCRCLHGLPGISHLCSRRQCDPSQADWRVNTDVGWRLSEPSNQ